MRARAQACAVAFALWRTGCLRRCVAARPGHVARRTWPHPSRKQRTQLLRRWRRFWTPRELGQPHPACLRRQTLDITASFGQTLRCTRRVGCGFDARASLPRSRLLAVVRSPAARMQPLHRLRRSRVLVRAQAADVLSSSHQLLMWDAFVSQP